MAKKKKKHKKDAKYLGQVCKDESSFDRIGAISISEKQFLNQDREERSIPEEILLKVGECPGVFFGGMEQYEKGCYIGMPQGAEGNILVVGGNGSGKSAGIGKPTFVQWGGTICATDVKGELSDFYADLSKTLSRKGIMIRPYLIFDPTQVEGLSYDPFWWLLQDDSSNLFHNIQEIALAIIPIRPEEKDPFWTETERGVFAAALLYYFQLGLSFSEAICSILEQPLSSLCEKLANHNDIRVNIMIGQMSNMKEETIASVDRGLRNKLMLFADDPAISHAFRGVREGANCFNWDDLQESNLFLRIPADKIEQWSGAINLMYTQLIRYLERRPEMHSAEGANNVQTLLLMDEFARFGKLEMITSAMSTLRSKNVNICLMIQSVAQLDSIYGEYGRRIIFDNCQYKAILRADDAKTQKYLSELIGTCIRRQHSVSEQLDDSMKITGYSVQIGEIRDWTVYPHELSTLKEVLLLTPQGFYRMEKLQPNSDLANDMLPPAFKRQTAVIHSPRRNEGAKILSIEERSQRAHKRIALMYQQPFTREQAQGEISDEIQCRNYIIGELAGKYFPEIHEIELGTSEENEDRFQLVEAFLAVLSNDSELVEQLKEKASSRCI